MTVIDSTIAAESSGDFFNSRGRKGLNASKKMAKVVLKNHRKLRRPVLTLVERLHLEAPKQFYHHYLK